MAQKGLVVFFRKNLLITFLHARLTTWYFLNKQTPCLWVLTSSDKIAFVGVGLGITGWMPIFLSVTHTVPQWVLNTTCCAIKTRYSNGTHSNVRAQIQVYVKVHHILVCRYNFEGCEQVFRKCSENIVFFGRHVDVVFFRAMSRTFFISNTC